MAPVVLFSGKVDVVTMMLFTRPALSIILSRRRGCAARRSNRKFTIVFDSSIRTGSDVIKTISMDAQGVLSEWYVCLWMFGS
jgi:hypothetical protein